jgi:hypothetical protein
MCGRQGPYKDCRATDDDDDELKCSCFNLKSYQRVLKPAQSVQIQRQASTGQDTQLS